MDMTYAGFILLLFLPYALPVALKLERVPPIARGVVNLTLLGSPNSFGFYFTKVKIGSPPREFNLMVDTGSYITWVSCKPCDGCPTYNNLGIQLMSFDPDSSSSASRISCADNTCRLTGSTCSSHGPLCTYTEAYEDLTMTNGFYISDIFHFDTMAGSATMYSSTSVVFGCSQILTGRLAESGTAVDGILGLGPGNISFFSQLSSRGIIPKIFSHCLRGDNDGGTLVLGEIQEPGIIYSPLVPSRPLYNLNLQSIAINGNVVQIDPTVFQSGRGTIVDSGTTRSIIAEMAYDPFIDSLTVVVSRFGRPKLIESFQCFQVSDRVDDIFPVVSFNFEGGASMNLKPKDYLVQTFHDGVETWCISFRKSQGQDQSETILGELVLRDKIIIYDLAKQRLGWVDYNCSKPVNISSTNNITENTRHKSGSSSRVDTHLKSVLASSVTLLAYIFIFG